MRFLMAGAAALTFGFAAQAATVVVNHDFNVASIVPNGLGSEPLATPVTLGVGDTLDLTINFSAPVVLTGEIGVWALLLTSGSSATLDVAGTLEFLGASGNIVSGPIGLSTTNSFVHVGSFYGAGLYRLDAAPISFTGLRQIITIDSDDIGAPREYNRVSFTYFQNVAPPPPPVPEPATWAMMIAGFGMVGCAARRRRLAAA